jgi:uncharacterized protein (DUF433 family)
MVADNWGYTWGMQNGVSNHIEITPGTCGGRPRIAGHRITVQNIAIWHERMGMSADEIATEYELSLGEVHAALAFYHDNREEIDAAIRADEALVAELKKNHRSTISKVVPMSSSAHRSAGEACR